VGRERELVALADVIPRERLVTLLGAGGVGKTRLVREIVSRVGDRFAGGAVFLELAGLADPDLLLPAIAAGLGLRSTDDDILDAVAERIGERTLIVLDNFERITAAAPTLSLLLDVCPLLHVVVTSRVALRLDGEREFGVGPLEVPSERSANDRGRVLGVESVQLFLDRASARGFDASSADAGELDLIAGICRRLGGWPLAIELAASRVKLLGLRGLGDGLGDPLATLAGGTLDAEPRHQTIAATIAWSHDLLSAEERHAFETLSTFRGGFTVDAAAALLAEGGPRPALDVIARLVDQTLLQVDLGGPEARFSMLEPVREFASSRLDDGTRGLLRRRHFDFYLRLAERGMDEERGADQATWLRRMGVERDNVRQALEHARSAGDGVGLLRLASALERRFWLSIGDVGLAENRAWLETALELGKDAPGAIRGRALLRLAWAIDSSPDEIAVSLRRALAEFERVRDIDGQVEALSGLGTVAAHQGDWTAATTVLGRGLDLASSRGRRPDVLVELLAALGQTHAGQGDAAAGRARLEEAFVVATETGDLWGRAYVLSNLGQLAITEARIDDAEASLSAARQVALDVGDVEEYVASTIFLAVATLLRGDLEAARDLIVAVAAADDRTASRVLVLDAVSLWLDVAGRGDAAAVCRSIADRAASGRITRRVSWDLIRTAVEAPLLLGRSRSRAVESPGGLGLAAGIAFGIDQLAAAIPKEPPGVRLTAREQEVLALLIRGRSDEEIANELFISKKTVSVHVSRIKDKLRARSRVDIAVRALRLGLASV
jgi:predicted ATPase/DNA-binding CsgD family transcriptional regulator